MELKINPTILSEVKLSTPVDDNTIQITPLASFFKERVKNLHPLVHVQKEHLNNNSSVNKLITPKKEKEEIPSSATRTPQEHDRNKEESAISAPKDQTKINEVERAFLLQQVRLFWKYAKSQLYPELIISDPEEKEVLNHIWRSVYKKFNLNGNKKQWENFQKVQYNRVDMVKRWLKRNPNHWIPAPYLYFNPHNTKNGFDKTWAWYLKQEKLKIDIRNQILIQKTDHEWRLHNKGEGKHKHKTRFELYRLHCKRLSKYQNNELLSVYNNRLHNHLF